MLLTINQQRRTPNYKLGALTREGGAIYPLEKLLVLEIIEMRQKPRSMDSLTGFCHWVESGPQL